MYSAPLAGLIYNLHIYSCAAAVREPAAQQPAASSQQSHAPAHTATVIEAHTHTQRLTQTHERCGLTAQGCAQGASGQRAAAMQPTITPGGGRVSGGFVRVSTGGFDRAFPGGRVEWEIKLDVNRKINPQSSDSDWATYSALESILSDIESAIELSLIHI